MTHRVIGFLQNCWFLPDTPTYIIDMYLTNHEYRRKVLARSRTGRSLQRAFGSYFNEIWWDNASLLVGDHPSTKFDHDLQHMQKTIDAVDPLAVVAFGRVACHGMQELYRGKDSKPWHAFPHPMAYGLSSAQMTGFAEEVIQKYFR